MFSSCFHRVNVALGPVKHVALCGVIFALMFSANGTAQAQRTTGLQPPKTLKAASDFTLVFINGEFVESPYEIHHDDDGVYVNGHRLEIADAALDSPGKGGGKNRGFGRGGGPGAGRRGQRSGGGAGRTQTTPAVRLTRELQGKLLSTGLVVAFDGYPIRVVPIDGEGLLGLLIAGDSVTEERLVELKLTESADETAVWMDWLADYEISPDLQSQIQAVIDRVVALETEFQSSVAQVARLEQYAYPLTVLGMLLGVVALGYLLQWAGNGLNQLEATAESERYVVIALCMMASMATIDFIWTVLAAQAGQMKEVNPLAARFIESPTELAVFKILATGIGFGILYFWRQRQQVRQATWWMCLVSVLLTFRWVMFDSMRV